MAFQIPQNVPLEELENPDFENAGRVHDWRNHIDEEVKQQWDRLTLEERAIAYLSAENDADNEEWD